MRFCITSNTVVEQEDLNICPKNDDTVGAASMESNEFTSHTCVPEYPAGHPASQNSMFCPGNDSDDEDVSCSVAMASSRERLLLLLLLLVLVVPVLVDVDAAATWTEILAGTPLSPQLRLASSSSKYSAASTPRKTICSTVVLNERQSKQRTPKKCHRRL